MNHQGKAKRVKDILCQLWNEESPGVAYRRHGLGADALLNSCDVR